MSITCIALSRAYYNARIIKPGEKFTFKGDACPVWAKPVNPKKTEQVKQDTPEQTKIPLDNTPVKSGENVEVVTAGDGGVFEVPGENKGDTATEAVIPEDLAGKTEEELSEILEDLLTQGLNKNIMLDGTNKTIIEQIVELRNVLCK